MVGSKSVGLRFLLGLPLASFKPGPKRVHTQADTQTHTNIVAMSFNSLAGLLLDTSPRVHDIHQRAPMKIATHTPLPFLGGLV